MALDATLAGVASNSYITVTDADSYVADRIGFSAWSAASLQIKSAALIHATETLDKYVDWYGYIATITQRLRWPRWGIYTRDNLILGSGSIPDEIRFLTVDVADWIIANGGLSVETNTVSQVVVGGSTKGIKVVMDPNMNIKGFPRDVIVALNHWGHVNLTASGAKSVRLQRV